MNKKKILGITMAAMMTLISISTNVFAKENTTGVNKAVNGTVVVNGNKTDTSSQISNDEAEQIAKNAFSKYLGININQKIKEDGLKVSVSNFGDSILISYEIDDTKAQENAKNNIIDDNDDVIISAKDGSIKSICGMNDIEEKEYTWDETKIKAAAEKYLKDNGMRTDVQTITADDEKKSIGLVGAHCQYADGSEITLELSAKDYSIVYYGYFDNTQNANHKPVDSSITDEKATQIAKNELSNYLGVDIEQKIKADGLKTDISRYDDEIIVTFDADFSKYQKDSENKIMNDNFSAIISAKDGSLTSVCGIDNLEEKEYPFDEAKIKAAAAKYLKDKGLRTDVQTITADDEKKSIGLVGADCEYADGSKILLEFSAKDYSAVCVSIYGAVK